MNTKNIISWALRLTVAGILLQTLYFKFSAHPDSVHIFSTLGLEPYGRVGTGVMELIAAILVLYNRTIAVGALMSFGLMVGAIGSHLFTPLGVNVNGDGGSLFTLAVIVAVCSAILMVMYKNQLIQLYHKLIHHHEK